MTKASCIYRQHGVTLVELLVGVAIGLLVVAASTVALLTSQGVTTAVSDASQLQQQASYAFRVIGHQVRQAGGLTLRSTTMANASAELTLPSRSAGVAIDGGLDDDSATFTVRYQQDPRLRNCIGKPAATEIFPPRVVSSVFRLNDKSELVCGSDGDISQPIISNVKDMTVRFLKQENASGNRFTYLESLSNPSNARKIYAVEVCLEMEGDMGNVPTDADASYINCRGQEVGYDRRLKMVFHNTFYLPNHVWGGGTL